MNLDSTLIMGIVNVTPDSFSGDGVAFDFKKMDQIVQKHIQDGADILDIGGQSTRPGAIEVEWRQELDRVIPAIKHIRQNHPKVKLSVDTFRPEVMQAALDVGVDMINDVKAFSVEGAMSVIEKAPCEIIMMHMQGQPRTMQDSPSYTNVVQEVSNFLADRMVQIHQHCQVPFEKMWIDPGFGFGKLQTDNFKLLANINQFVDVNPNICVGMSRKSMIAYALGDDQCPRQTGTACANVIAWQKGARMFRVHDVKETVDALKIAQQVMRVT